MTNPTTGAATLASKPHYPILDGLRGVAAIIVVAFHLFEIHATNPHDQIINHGYLAVDFFFLLSGFVIGYAYDDQWGKMSVGNFFKRRIIRLQPMVVLGSLIGAACFYFGQSELFHLISKTSIWTLALVTLLGCFMIPIPASMDVRCWGEMFPLNGPAWSLFFEYIAYILYGLIVRRFSKLLLTILVVVSGLILFKFVVFDSMFGNMLGGHVLDFGNLKTGMIRLLYPFFCGLLMFRLGKLINVKGAFWLCSLILIVIFSLPRIGTENWTNGLYEALAIILVFPLVVLMGAGSPIKGKISLSVCDFLGKISFPMYIIHYPIIYIYMAYTTDNKLSWQDNWMIMVAIWLGCIVLAYLCLKLYDEPVRKWLSKRA